MIEQKKVGLLVGSFVLILIAIVILQSSADVVSDATDVKGFTDKAVTITSGSGNLGTTGVVGISKFGNATNNTALNAGIVLGANVNVTRNGTIQVAQNLNITPTNQPTSSIVFGNGAYLATFTYEGANYISDSSARSTTKLIPLFLALAIMSIAVAMAYNAFKDEFGMF